MMPVHLRRTALRVYRGALRIVRIQSSVISYRLVAILLTVSACRVSESVKPSEPVRAVAATWNSGDVDVTQSAATGAAADSVARGLALAVGQTQPRTEVLPAMRKSHWNEHKLTLQQFAITPAGRHALARAAAGLHIAPESMAQLIARLPPMDFYASFREHRKTWRATADVLVGSVIAKRAPTMTAYAVDGTPAT